MRLEELAGQNCVPCEGAKPMTAEEVEISLGDLPGWQSSDGSIQKEFRFKSYVDGLEFAYSVGKIAEQQNHHPDISIKWRRVQITLSTHSVKGLSPNDFIMAAKVELGYRKLNHQ